ncbi:class II aldolase [Listeria immobilis]|uniref:class II aldolase n=1 Tax=Listeria immobilis TaxID=2713502 RepID=UPI00162AD42E|nr:class II aldolase [Listeria immobilis]MBC1517157.1 class II aldolase [Listeria immobilis]MBC6298323.1 class II aldolase [Listeria immobilis]
MPLVNGYTLLEIIQERKVIAGAFNTTNLETTVGILQAVEKTCIPTFIQVAPTNISLAGYDYLVDMVSRYAENMDTPVAMHLDHGKKFEDVKSAIRAGFTSVMIDGATFDFEKNIAFTKKAVDFAKAYGVPVEAELGAILGKEDDHVSEADSKTDPAQVKEFVERTGCDMLAISVGNVHGLEDKPKIDFDLLKEINEVSPVPLVIHGGSGIPDKHIQQMVNYNVTKINIASDLRQSYIRSVGKAYESNPNEANLIKVLQHAEDSVFETVYAKILSMNSVVQR